MSCVQRHRTDLDQQKALYAGGVAWTALAFNVVSNLHFRPESCDSDEGGKKDRDASIDVASLGLGVGRVDFKKTRCQRRKAHL